MKIIVVSHQTEEITKICSELNRHGFQCIYSNSKNALEQIKNNRVNLILVALDDSTEINSVCRVLHQESSLPIIAITPMETISNLDNWADDFIIKPCNYIELQIRINRLINNKKPEVSDLQLVIGSLKIDFERYEVFIDDRLISLTFKEYGLLKFLASHPGKVYTRDVLLNQVWGEDYYGGDRTVDVYIRYLRSKIEDESHSFIETVRNIGYRFIGS